MPLEEASGQEYQLKRVTMKVTVAAFIRIPGQLA